jgi:hypothetical protein
MYTNQQASQVQQSITHYTKKCNTHTFMDILNSPEYTDKIETLFPAQRGIPQGQVLPFAL